VKAEVKITARPITVKVDDLAKQYDGKALEPMSVSVIQGSLAHEGHKIELSKAAFTGSQKAVGSSQSTVTGVTVSGTKAENYIITHAPGTLKVTPAPKPPKPKKPTPNPPNPPTPAPVPTSPPAPDEEPVADVTPAAREEPEEVVTRPPTNTDVDVARTVTEPAEPKTTEFSPEDQAKIEAQTGNPVTDIIKGNVPRGSFMSTAVWSLLSLIMSLAAVIITLCLIIGSLLARRRRDDDPGVYGEDRDEERRNQRKGRILKVLACAVGVITAVLRLVLDDLTQPMAWINRWTVLVGIAFVLHIAALIAYKVRKKNINRENGEEQEAA
ncbi:MAG: YDG domain-containing protein, partial [Clostridiales Family XIII bacterium]|nr:YDG domain-containing protein [Clostridiales Family XIII bacterium]